jgi:hypothetical protein
MGTIGGIGLMRSLSPETRQDNDEFQLLVSWWQRWLRSRGKGRRRSDATEFGST